MTMDGGTRRRADDEADPLIGRVLSDRFKVVRRIGRGGVGAVYLAMQAPFERPCALKVLRPRFEGNTEEFHRRFFLEASTAAKLRHPNNVAVFDYGRTEDDMYFMAMEYLEGRTLRDAIRAEGPFDEERATHIARQVCRALREAHHHGVIHRDVKPANIFLIDRYDEKDFVKVLDFGLVKDVTDDDGEDLTQAGQFMGSPKYVAPEQIQGRAVDVRTDIYALGVVMYEMVTGRVPFDGGATVKTLIAHIKEDIVPLRRMNPSCSVTPLFEQVIYRCMAKEADDRFASMDELLGLLKQTPAGELTGTHLGDSGQAMLDSGRIALSGALPQSAMFTAPGAAASIAAEPDTRGTSWSRRYGKTALATAVAATAVVITVVMINQRGRVPVDAGIPSTPSAVTVDQTAVTPPVTASETATPEAQPERFVVIELTPPNAAVSLPDGTRLCDGSPCRIPVSRFSEGSLEVSIGANGYLVEKKRLSVDEGQSVRLVPIRVAAPPTTKPEVPKGYKGNPFGDVPPY